MSQAVITKAFVEWKAQQAVDNKPVTLDEFIFAFIPDLDIENPIDDTETTPPAGKIVHRQAVSKSGVINGNSVVYSVTLGADVGDFDFNWIGLVNKATGTLAMIIHAPTQRKIKNASGQQGNVLVRSMLMEYSGAEAATNITTPAETWQIDFTARLASMDERQRLENIDLYGAAAFFGTGYLVGKNNTQYFVTKGAGYVAGLRTELLANQNIAVSTKPVKVWLDVSWTGTLTSVWTVKSKITVASDLSNYVEGGVQHYVFALASIDANGNITDLRPAGGLADQALKAHEKSRNHPDATTTEKGFTRLSSAVDSTSESLAATPKAVKAVNDDLKAVKESLGSSASRDVTASRYDATSGRVLQVGDYGLGVGNGTTMSLTSIYDIKCSGIYNALGNGSSNPAEGMPDDSGNTRYSVFATNVYTNQYWITLVSNVEFYVGNVNTANKTSVWYRFYNKAYKPTAGDVGAVAKTGDTMTGRLIVNFDGEGIRLQPKTAGYASYIISVDSGNVNHWYIGAGSSNNADVVFNNYKAGNNSINLKGDGTINITATNGKNVNIAGQAIPSNYANFDGRYYTKTQSDARFQPKGSYTPAGQAYTKAESDARYQAKGSYITGIRFGASAEYQERGNSERMTGGAMTSFADRGSSNYWIRLRPLQYQINGGSWVTAAYT
ncbi:phage tail-collar fiber domain-containing protein [Enterobacter cloacae]|uniref:phage tail-collar fiber domain-containing protein n=1 Tax=Enterobacter cloacae TaxID=550 RepID=UPI002B1F10C5|nr:phage tail protein [Enterobacter cloacae]MEA5217490.1 phage tail protein [Enterobacter cloacae]